ncbi:MAG: calcium-binding protein, partial [Pseudomonadota bacterium]
GTDEIALDTRGFTALPAMITTGNLRLGTEAQDSNDFLIYDTISNPVVGALFYDADADGPSAAVRIALLNGSPALNSADFDVF